MSRKTVLTIVTVAIQLVCLYLAFRNQSGFLGPIMSGYIVAVLVVVMTLRSGSEAGCRFFRLLASIAGIPALLIFTGYILSHNDPDMTAKAVGLAFLAAFALQLIMVIAFKPGRAAAGSTSAQLEGNAALMQDIHEQSRIKEIERRRREQRGRAMRAETDNVLHERRIRELEAENKKLRDEIRKLRTILADPFHDPIPMEEKI